MKKMMKKALILSLLLSCFTFYGCGNEVSNTVEDEEILSNEIQDEIIQEEITQDGQNEELKQEEIKQEEVKKEPKKEEVKEEKKYDIDLTKLNSTMVYSQVNDMMVNPQNYLGKSVKMKGTFSVFQGDERNYYACIIVDATACCSQGIEFELKDERKYPEEYPTDGSDITVSGKFSTYLEGEYMYCTLKDAIFE